MAGGPFEQPTNALPARHTRKPDGQIRRLIVQAAEQLLTDRGINQSVTVTKIAATAGLTPPAIYHYFDDSAQIIAAVIDEIFAEARFAVASPPTGHPVDDLYQLCDNYLIHARGDTDRYRLLMNSDLATPVQRDWIQRHFTDILTDAITACTDSTRSGHGDSSQNGILVWAFLHGLASSKFADPAADLAHPAPRQIIKAIAAF